MYRTHMAILFKSLISELKIRYTVPKVEIFKQTEDGQYPDNYIKARTLFYDFYAMDNLHNHLGENPYLDKANPIKKSVAAQNRGVSWYDPSEEDLVVFPASGHVLDESLRDLIESVFEQVTKAIANKLMVHLRLGLIQELRHLLDYSSWESFYLEVGNTYNRYNKNLTARQFQEIVDDKIPGMSNELESVVRLLKFTKAYRVHTSVSADAAVKAMKTGDVYDDTGPLSGHEEGVPIKIPGEDEPDTTDYGADAIEDSPYWEEEPSPEKPLTKDPSGYIQHGDYWNPDPGAAVYHSDKEPEEFDDYGNPKKKKQNYAFTHKKDKSKLTEATPPKFYGARMSPELLKSIRHAINQSGLRWEDVDNAYNKIEWSSAFGGKMWGTGTKSYLKLVARASEMDAQEMANVVDHIFDLMHNTGGLLNKGGMYIADEDLDRRAKCTHIARYLPYVSPDVKKLISRFLKYYPGNAEEQKDIDKVINSPHSKGFTPEQEKVLQEFGFYKYGWAYKADIQFFSKKLNKHGQPIEIYGRYYEIRAHEDGRFSVADGLKADIQIFDTFAEVPTYIEKTFSKYIIKKKNIPYSASTPPPPPPQSEKQIYISSHTTTRLSSDKEAQLLTVNMGWRPKSNYYKAYFAGSKRFYLYAFNDGSLLTTYENSVVFKTFLDWNAAFIHISGETKDAEDYTKHSALAPATPSATNAPVVTPTPDNKMGGLTQAEYNQLSSIVSVNGLAVGVSLPGGPVPVTISGTHTKVFSVGNLNTLGKYNVWQTSTEGITIGSWNFSTFAEMRDFISKHIASFVTGTAIPVPKTTSSPPVASQSMPTPQLPLNAVSSATYSMHSGLDVPPKQTIRLTILDESTLNELGFLPKMVGKDVYYIHNKSGDAVKFYPNNTASLSFSKAGGSSVKFDIKKMMQWLDQKYTPTSVSPLKAPSTIYTMGIQAGPLFEAKIVSAGFNWEPQTGRYVDIKINGKNSIYIRPNRSSVVSIVDTLTNTPEQHYFANLPALMAYLSTKYPIDSQKKTEPVTSNEPYVPVNSPTDPVILPPPTSPQTLVFPPWVPSELRRLMKACNFTYSGPVDDDKTSYRYHYGGGSHVEKSNVLYIHPDQTFLVFDERFYKQTLGQSISSIKYTSVSDIMVNYLQPKAKQNPPEPTSSSTKSNVNFTPGEPITVKPSWVPPKAFQLMEKGKYVYNGPVPTYPKSFGYINTKGNVIWMHPGNEYVVFDKNVGSETYDVDEFLEYLYEKYGSLPGGTDTNEDLAAQIDSTLKQAALVEPIGTITHDKLDAIKYLKTFVEQKTGKPAKLSNLKHCIENYPWFISYVKQYGLPPMGLDDNTLYILNDFSMTINKPRLEPTGYTYKIKSDESAADLIKLNPHDHKLLELCGFKWTPQENHYYKDAAGRIAKFTDTGTAMLIDANAENNPFDTVPELLKYIVTHYGPESSLKKGASTPSTMQKDTTTQHIEKLGFYESDYEPNTYLKKDTHPAHGEIFHKIILNPSDESMKYKILMKGMKGGLVPMSEHDFDSIPAGLNTIEGWMGKDKKDVPSSSEVPYSGVDYAEALKDSVPPSYSIHLNVEDEETLKKIGYTKHEVEGQHASPFKIAYEKGSSRIFFHANGTADYWKDEHGKTATFHTIKEAMQFLWDKNGPNGTPQASLEEKISYKSMMRAMLE